MKTILKNSSKRTDRLVICHAWKNGWSQKVLPRFELGLPDSESGVLTVTPQDQMSVQICGEGEVVRSSMVQVAVVMT